MSEHKDYYAILGVLPTAEAVVIRAAYKALAQRYHPDRYAGPKEEANHRMTEINEAYSVLSDVNKRTEYDKIRRSRSQDDSSCFDEDSENAQPDNDPLQKDWEIATKYYSDLKKIEFRLSKISWRLAYSYKAYLLETKTFGSRNKLADDMERQFLELYFGNNEEIITFAIELIMSGHKVAARALNKAVSVLGNNIDPLHVIVKIKDEYGLTARHEKYQQPTQSNHKDLEGDNPRVGWLVAIFMLFIIFYVISISSN